MSLEEGVARIEATLEQIDKRLNHLESDIRELRSELRSFFRWSIGLTIGVWATVLTLMLPILLKLLGAI